MTPAALDVSFVVPCHDEEGNLRALVAEIHRAVAPLGLAYEIVITDDLPRFDARAPRGHDVPRRFS